MRSIAFVIIGTLCCGFSGIEAFGQDNPMLKFIENKNQWSRVIDYAARVPGGHVGISSSGFTVNLIDQEKLEHDHTAHTISEADGSATVDPMIDGHTIQINFLNARKSSPNALSEKSSEYYNYFLGQDSTQWASRAYAYSRVRIF